MRARAVVVYGYVIRRCRIHKAHWYLDDWVEAASSRMV